MKLLLHISIFILTSSYSFAQKTITVGVTPMVLKSSQGQFSKKIFTKIFNKLNYKLIVKQYPPLRLAERMKSGNIDAELIRVSNYGDTRPYLTKVTEPHFHFSIAAYSAIKNLKLKGWSDLKNRLTGYRKGVKVVENKVKKVISRKKLFEYSDVKRALKLLNLHRLEFYVGIEYFIDEILKKMRVQDHSNIYKVATLTKDSAHFYLGKKFSHMAKEISNELIIMKKSGEFKRIMKK